MATEKNRKALNVTIDSALVDRIKTQADERVVSPALLVERGMEFYLDRLPTVAVEAVDRPGSEVGDGR